jgi:hypothetical protein
VCVTAQHPSRGEREGSGRSAPRPGGEHASHHANPHNSLVGPLAAHFACVCGGEAGDWAKGGGRGGDRFLRKRARLRLNREARRPRRAGAPGSSPLAAQPSLARRGRLVGTEHIEFKQAVRPTPHSVVASRPIDASNPSRHPGTTTSGTRAAASMVHTLHEMSPWDAHACVLYARAALCDAPRTCSAQHAPSTHRRTIIPLSRQPATTRAAAFPPPTPHPDPCPKAWPLPRSFPYPPAPMRAI